MLDSLQFGINLHGSISLLSFYTSPIFITFVRLGNRGVASTNTLSPSGIDNLTF